MHTVCGNGQFDMLRGSRVGARLGLKVSRVSLTLLVMSILVKFASLEKLFGEIACFTCWHHIQRAGEFPSISQLGPKASDVERQKTMIPTLLSLQMAK